MYQLNSELDKQLTYENPYIIIKTLMYNDAKDICARACASCYKTSVSDDYEKKSRYIAARTKVGHDSVIEHSNLVIQVMLKLGSDKICSDIYTMLIDCKYLNVTKCYKYLNQEDTNIYTDSFIIGGSLRGFKYMIKEYYEHRYIDNYDNVIIEAIIEYFQKIWYEYKCFFEDVQRLYIESDETIVYKPMRFSFFNDIISVEERYHINKNMREVSQELFGNSYKYPEIIDITGCCIHNSDEVFEISPINWMSYFNTPIASDVLKFVSITVRFVNMSRTCTHQLVRHRNAITQQSQRYVDASESTFTLSGDKSELEKTVSIYNTDMTFEEASKYLFNESLNNYKNLISHGVKKEDARSILLANTNCEEIYMTFTGNSFLKFLELRADPHAQTEIRNYALALKTCLILNI